MLQSVHQREERERHEKTDHGHLALLDLLNSIPHPRNPTGPSFLFAVDDDAASIARSLIMPDSSVAVRDGQDCQGMMEIPFPSYFALYLSEVGIDTLLDMICVVLS